MKHVYVVRDDQQNIYAIVEDERSAQIVTKVLTEGREASRDTFRYDKFPFGFPNNLRSTHYNFMAEEGEVSVYFILPHTFSWERTFIPPDKVDEVLKAYPPGTLAVQAATEIEAFEQWKKQTETPQ